MVEMDIEKRQKKIERKVLTLESMICDIYDAVITNKKICPVCKNKIRLYTPVGEVLRINARCPACGAVERHRAMYLYWEKYTKLFIESTNVKILHFAPEKCFSDIFKKMKNVDYYPVDKMVDNFRYEGLRKNVDITEITYEDEFFDYVICIHVLEHVEEDKKAMRELYRVLKKNGEAYLNVPIGMHLEKTLEDPAINTPELRLKYYGQANHVRCYGCDFVTMLTEVGWKVDMIKISEVFSQEEILKYHLMDEYIFRCVKK